MKKDYRDLQSSLLSDPSVFITISHVRDDVASIMSVGDVFDREFIAKIAARGDIDTMGERGEFHTLVQFRH